MVSTEAAGDDAKMRSSLTDPPPTTVDVPDELISALEHTMSVFARGVLHPRIMCPDDGCTPDDDVHQFFVLCPVEGLLGGHPNTVAFATQAFTFTGPWTSRFWRLVTTDSQRLLLLRFPI